MMYEKSRRTFVFSLFLVILIGVPIFIAAQPISFNVAPGLTLPDQGNGALFMQGINARVDVDWLFQPGSPFIVNAGFDYASLPVKLLSQQYSLVGASIGCGFLAHFFERLGIRCVASGGAYQGFFDGNSGGAAYYRLDADATWRLAPSFSAGLCLSYISYDIGSSSPLGLANVNLLFSFSPKPEKKIPFLEISSIELSPLFPVFRKYFDTHAFGKLSLVNKEPRPIEKIRVSFFVKGLMDAPKTCEEIAVMKPGETRDVDIFALLNESILDITEETIVQGTLLITYECAGETVEASRIESVRVYHRNAMTWEDDRRAAAFVTAMDPTVLRFSKSVNAVVRDDPSPAGSLNLRLAIGLFEKMGFSGIRYAISPGGAYSELAVNKYAIDFLQFPRQTMEYKGGDCSDLSVLYAALLESLGIETAFITLPGHIFIAFDAGISPAEASAIFASIDDFIAIGDRVWIPVEITLVKNGFLDAWKEAGREWREYVDTRNIIPLHDAWTIYEPVGLPGEAIDLGELSSPEFTLRYETVIREFAQREVAVRGEELKAEIQKTGSSPAAINKLGVLYARFGLFNEARTQFENAIASSAAINGKDYATAYANLGNLFYLRNDQARARETYMVAINADPDCWVALLGMAKIEYSDENYGTAKDYYARALAQNPGLASKFSFLAERSSDTTRAAAADVFAVVEWSE